MCLPLLLLFQQRLVIVSLHHATMILKVAIFILFLINRLVSQLQLYFQTKYLALPQKKTKWAVSGKIPAVFKPRVKLYITSHHITIIRLIN